MGRFDDKTAISIIADGDVLPITDISDNTDDKKISMSQMKTFCATDISGKQDLITSPTNNHIVTTDGSGQTKDSGITSTSVTIQGNTFNGASQLVQLDADSKLPAVDGSQLTNVVPVDAITALGTLSTGTHQLTNRAEHTAAVTGSCTITMPDATANADYAFLYFTTTGGANPTIDVDGWGYTTTQPTFSTTTSNFVKLHKNPLDGKWTGEYVPLVVA